MVAPVDRREWASALHTKKVSKINFLLSWLGGHFTRSNYRYLPARLKKIRLLNTCCAHVVTYLHISDITDLIRFTGIKLMFVPRWFLRCVGKMFPQQNVPGKMSPAKCPRSKMSPAKCPRQSVPGKMSPAKCPRVIVPIRQSSVKCPQVMVPITQSPIICPRVIVPNQTVRMSPKCS